MVLPEADKLTNYYLATVGGEAAGLLALHVPELTELHVPELTELLKVGPRGSTFGPYKLTTSYILFAEVFLLLPLNYWKLDLIFLSVLSSR
jgi:hypothetical protein